MPKRDTDTGEAAIVLGVLGLGLLLLFRGGGGASSAGALHIVVQGDTFALGEATYSTCTALMRELPPGSVTVDPTQGSHRAVVELLACLRADGRAVAMP